MLNLIDIGNKYTKIKHHLYFERKFRQWWSTIQPIPTKRMTTYHLNSLNTKEEPRLMTLEINVIDWDRHKTWLGETDERNNNPLLS